MLAHLAHRLTSRTEDLATEALAYILKESRESRDSLRKMYQDLGIPLCEDLRYRTQVCLGKDARHDLVGLDSSGKARVIIETKFWAGLTEAQPMGYLNHVGDGGLLLFIAPRARLLTLWDKLMACIKEKDAGFRPPEPHSHVCIVGTRTLALRSWEDVLELLLKSEGLTAGTRHDVEQLKGLCDQMDTDAIQPLTEDELRPAVGRRMLQYGSLVEQIIRSVHEDAVQEGRAFSKEGTTAGNLWFGRNLRLCGYSCCLYFSAWRWSTWGSSPIWLSIKGLDGRPCPWLAPVLQRLDMKLEEEGGILYVPIQLAKGLEDEDLVSQATTQISMVHACLAVSGGGGDAHSIGGENAITSDEIRR